MARTWRWVRPDVAEAVHREQIGEHGGGAGTRDAGLLASAFARPEHLAAYGAESGDGPDAAALAAAYAFGIARNHPFVDGNKRTALAVAETFLAINGLTNTASDAQAVVAFVALAEGELSEDELADWFREHLA